MFRGGETYSLPTPDLLILITGIMDEMLVNESNVIDLYKTLINKGEIGDKERQIVLARFKELIK